PPRAAPSPYTTPFRSRPLRRGRAAPSREPPNRRGMGAPRSGRAGARGAPRAARGPAPAITLAPPGSAVRVFRAPQRDPNRSRAGGVRAAPFSPLLSLMADARPRAVLKRQI